jgi:MFS family permease
MPAELFQGRRFATIYGALSLAASLGAATGPWVAGLLYDRAGNYDLAFGLAAVVSLFCVLCGWLAAPRKVRLVAGQAARRQRLNAARDAGARGLM